MVKKMAGGSDFLSWNDFCGSAAILADRRNASGQGFSAGGTVNSRGMLYGLELASESGTFHNQAPLPVCTYGNLLFCLGALQFVRGGIGRCK